MPGRPVILASSLILVVLHGRPLDAQADTSARVAQSANRRDVLRVTRVSGAVRLDGTMHESFWSAADSIMDFRQREPAEGAPPSQRTVVKVARDGEELYVGVHAYDRNPETIRATQIRRDDSLGSDDNVTVLIDSFHDRRSAFLFQPNPHGAMGDAQFSGVDILNENWNGIWDVAVTRDSTG